MDASVNSSPTSYTSSGKDDTLNNSSAVQQSSNTSGNASSTPNTSVGTAGPAAALGPIGSKPSTPNPAPNAAITSNPWGSQQLRKGLGGAAIGSERSAGTNAAATSSDWFSPLKSAPGFERSRVGQYQQQQQQQAGGETAAQQAGHPGMQSRSVSTSGIATIGSGRRQVSEANSVRSSRPASPSLSVITSPPSVNNSSAFNPHQVNTTLSQTLQNNPPFLAQGQNNNNQTNAGQNGLASTPSELESAFDAMLRGSSVFQDLANRINRLEAQVHQLAAQDGPGQVNGHYDATPTRSPSVAGSTSSYLTAPLSGTGNRPQSLLLPNHALSLNSISTGLHSPSLPMQHASTEPSTPMYGPPGMGAPADRDVIRQLTVQLSALGNNVAQLMAQQQQMPQTPLGAPSGYDTPITPHSAHGHPSMHGGNHHHGGMGRPGMQNMRTASFDVPRGPVVPRGGPGHFGPDERETRKRHHPTLQAPTPIGMGSRRSSADVIENMHIAAEGMPGSAGGPGGPALGSQSLLGKWEALGVSGDMLRAIVKYGIGPPSKIQMKAIPCVLNTQDIVAQASSIQERIQCYVIPTLQVVYNNLQQTSMNDGSEQPYHGVQALVLTATIDQAGQAQRMCLGLGQALGITSSLVVGHGDTSQEAAAFAQNPPHVLVGTPQKLLDLLSQNTVPVDKLALLVIDEMDQLIARNLSEHVNNLAKLLPPPMSSAANSRERSPAINGPGGGFKPFEQGGPGRNHERQTAIFSCTVPQEVLNFASALNLREPVRVLVRRENNNNSNNNSSNNTNNNNVNANHNDRSNDNNAVAATSNIRGVKHWFLYLAVGNNAGSGRGPMSGRQENATSREWKLEALADLCVDADFTQAVVYCSSIDSVEAVAYKLSSRNLDALALHGDMGASARHAIVSKFRSGNIGQGRGMAAKRVLVVYDALCRSLSDIHQVAVVVNFDLPRAAEEYMHRVSCALSTGYGRAGSSVNIVSSSADIDMLRNIESYYRLKINELPPNLSNII